MDIQIHTGCIGMIYTDVSKLDVYQVSYEGKLTRLIQDEN